MRLAAVFLFCACCTNALPAMALLTVAGFGSAWLSISSKA